MAEGERWRASFTVPGAVAGYYQVLVNAYTHGPDGGPWLFDESHYSVWMYVSGTDGQLTRLFEDSIFPEGMRPAPGPLMADSAPYFAADTTGSTPWHEDSVYIEVVYYISQSQGLQPAVGTEVFAKYSNFGRSTWATVGESGIVAFRCPQEGRVMWIGGKVPQTFYVQGEKKVMPRVALNDSFCGQRIYAHVSKYLYLSWRNLDTSAEAITWHFWHSRPRIDWKVDFSKKSETYYSRNSDEITLGWRLTGRSRFLWVAAHEYGHALHHKALGGGWNAPNRDPHNNDKASSYKCALKEGFANYAGTIGSVTEDDPDGYYGKCYEHLGTPDAPSWPPWCRNITHYRKAEIEAWVAALFMDLIDDTEEDGDYTEYDAFYVARVFKTCQVKRSRRILPDKWHDRKNVSDIVWCLENRINPVVHRQVFRGIDSPIGVREKADEPDDWNHHHIRWTWLKNLKFGGAGL
ncbi:MAG: hypothetical protein OXU64_06415 [Gemmatimonadota bacterium]|nr:hypothetical protein [Gemmatimonadota bacterium]